MYRNSLYKAPMTKWIGKVAVVTGASSGVGKDIALKLVEYGLKVVGCGRNIDTLVNIKSEISKTAKGEFFPFKCDVSIEEEVQELFDFVKTNFNELSILINNAGFIVEGSILHGRSEDWAKMFETNVLGLCMCTREAFALIQKNEDSAKKAGRVPGHIINICSIAGHMVLASSISHVYGATKIAVTSITEAIRQELREEKSHIKVTQISPGYISTGFIYRGIEELDKDLINACEEPLQASDIADSIIFVLASEARSNVHEILIRPTTQLF